MNRFLALGAVALVGASAQATLVLHYGFNDPSTAANFLAANTNTVSASLATTFALPTFPISGSSVNGTFHSFTGTTVNDQGVGAGNDIAFVGTNGNGGTVTLSYNASLLSNQVLKQATRRSSTGFNDVDIDYSIDGGTTWNSIVANFNANTVGYGDPASLVTIALPTALDGQANAAIRWTFNGATSASANFRTDNITIDADVVPEPATMILLAGAAAIAARRRKA